MWHSFGHSLNCDNEFDEMSDLTVNTTDIKCRVYVAKFLCAHCLCLHGKLLFLCVSGTNISSWIGEVLFMCWQCLAERHRRIFFSATNHACAQVGAFFFLFFPKIFMIADVHIYLLSYHYAEFEQSWHCRSSVRFTGSKDLAFSFHSFTRIDWSLHAYFPIYLFFYIFLLGMERVQYDTFTFNTWKYLYFLCI